MPLAERRRGDMLYGDGMLIRRRAGNSFAAPDGLAVLVLETQPWLWNLALLTFHSWVVWRLMSHTWHKVLHGCRRRGCILTHPPSVKVMSCIYVGTSHMYLQWVAGRGWKSNYFFPSSVSWFLLSSVKQIRDEKLRRAVLRFHMPGSRVSGCESQTFGAALCQHQNNHLSILDFPLWGKLCERITRPRKIYPYCIDIYVPRNGSESHGKRMPL